MLKKQVEQIRNKWRTVILDFIKNNEEYWNILESELVRQTEKFDSFLEIYPEPENIFKCFSYFNPEDTQVVILGQDPYHGPNQAIGLSFGVTNDTKNPPSLKNIEKELLSDVNKCLINSSLRDWARQGVLMLNSSLTVVQSVPGSHIKLWEPFTKYIIDYINNNCKNIAFVAWGRFAFERMCDIDTKKNHLLVSSHPSPFSFNRTFRSYPSFKNSKPFSKINKLIHYPIEW